jgi:DNA polymerase III delta prime subunit
MEHLLFVEKYRPKTVQECILPESIKATFQGFVENKEIPNLLLSGSAGSGKTTIARAMCEEIGCDYLFINGSDESGIGTFRNKISNYASSVSLSGGRKIVIIDEADNLTHDAQRALRGGIEEFSINCSFIFTCNYKNKIIEAIHSRCSVIDFSVNGSKSKMASQFFKRVEYILNAENIKYSKEVVAAVIKKHFPDNRRVLNELQSYAAAGDIDAGILANIKDISIQELISAIKDKDLTSARKWVANNMDNDPTKIMRKIYDEMFLQLEPNSIPAVIDIISRHMYQSAFVADQEVNLVACITQTMIDASFK